MLESHPSYWMLNIDFRELTVTKELTVPLYLNSSPHYLEDSFVIDIVKEELGPYRNAFIDIKIQDPDGTVFQRTEDDMLNLEKYDWTKHSKENPLIIKVTESHRMCNNVLLFFKRGSPTSNESQKKDE